MYGVLNDCPKGHQKYLMSKLLIPQEEVIEDIPIFELKDDEFEFIDDQLFEFNISQTPELKSHSWNFVSKCIRENDSLVAGITAVIGWTICEIQNIWVQKELHYNGYGAALITELEKIAKESDVGVIELKAYDSQSKEFFEKYGYKVFGVLKDCPTGHKLYHLSKRL